MRSVLKAMQSVEEAVEAHDWARAERSNTALLTELQRFDYLLTGSGRDPSRKDLANVAAFLAAILERHEQAAAELRSVRDDVASELRNLRGAGDGVSRFVETAGT